MSELVSVVIPVFNCERFIGETIDSALGQLGVSVDLIVVDDGSTDGTAAVLDRYGERLRCLRRPHQGIPFSRNAGLAAAHAPWIAFLDADDLWLPNKLHLQLEHLHVNPDAAGCVTHAQNFFSEAEAVPGHRRLSEPVPGFSLSTLLGKRSLFERLGAFDESVQTSDNVDWFLRARDLGERIDVLPDVLVRRRLHSENTSRRKAEVAKAELVDAVRRSLDRRRNAKPPGPGKT